MTKAARFTKRSVEVERRMDGETPLPNRISGYGAVFYRAGEAGTEFELYDDVRERIMPGAFDAAIDGGDVRSLFNHDSNLILGRTTAGTLELSVDETGLRYSVTPPDSRGDVIEAVERGDVDGSSFMFFPTSVTWREEEREGKTFYIRELNTVQLLEVGPVVFPAYDATTSDARTEYERDALKDRDRYLHERSKINPDVVRVRARMVELNHR